MSVLENKVIRQLGIKQVGLLAALCGLGAIFYMAATFDTFLWDEDALRQFQGLRSSWLDDASVVASALAQTLVVVISIPTLALAMLLLRKRADAVAALLVIVPVIMNIGFKELVARPRPDFAIVNSPPDSFGFPSGHAVYALAFFGLQIFILGEMIKPLWLRRSVQVLLALMILACGASRVYLGVHWPSDVLVGYLVGGIGVLGLLWVRKKLAHRIAQ